MSLWLRSIYLTVGTIYISNSVSKVYISISVGKV